MTTVIVTSWIFVIWGIPPPSPPPHRHHCPHHHHQKYLRVIMFTTTIILVLLLLLILLIIINYTLESSCDMKADSGLRLQSCSLQSLWKSKPGTKGWQVGEYNLQMVVWCCGWQSWQSTIEKPLKVKVKVKVKAIFTVKGWRSVTTKVESAVSVSTI